MSAAFLPATAPTLINASVPNCRPNAFNTIDAEYSKYCFPIFTSDNTIEVLSIAYITIGSAIIDIAIFCVEPVVDSGLEYVGFSIFNDPGSTTVTGGFCTGEYSIRVFSGGGVCTEGVCAGGVLGGGVCAGGVCAGGVLGGGVCGEGMTFFEISSCVLIKYTINIQIPTITILFNLSLDIIYIYIYIINLQKYDFILLIFIKI
jgi:hypothetical protein